MSRRVVFRAFATVLALGTLPLAASCGQALGDIEIEQLEVRAAPDAGERVVEPVVDACEAGQRQCDGTLLATCVQRAGQTAWVQTDCAEQPGGRCVPTPTAHCEQAACLPGDRGCQGATPRRCGDDNEWQSLPECLSAAHCANDDASCPGGPPCCLDAACEPGTLRCNDGTRERCRSDRTGWEILEVCRTEELCLAGLERCEGQAPGTCRCEPETCQPNQTQCVGTTMQRCALSLTGWVTEEECVTPELCEQGLPFPSSCRPPQCNDGETTCTDAGVLQICRDDRTGFETLDVCDGPPFCDAAGGRCIEPECRVNEQRCFGPLVQRCLSDRTDWETTDVCDTPQLCNDDGAIPFCDEPECDVGEFRCQGAQPQVCNAGRTGFRNDGSACARDDLCSEARETCDFCLPNRQECTPNLTGRRTCNNQGTAFGPITNCPLGCIAATGTCQGCAEGQYECAGNAITRCLDGASFTPLGGSTDCDGNLQMTCNSGVLSPIPCPNGCSNQRNLCNECSGQQRRCVPGQNAFQVCSGGVFGNPQGCGGGLQCENGFCGCDEQAGPRCQGGQLQQCVNDSFVNAARCQGSVARFCQGGNLTQVDCGTPASCQAGNGPNCG